MPFIDDERAMELPQYSEVIPKFGTVDLSVPTKENLELNRRITQRDADLMRQVQADRSIPEKLAGGLQAGRLMGSALAQSVASIPTAITKGGKAAEEYIAENMYKPTQPLAYEYAGDVGDFLEKLETQYKIPPILPEAVALQYLTGPATAQAARAAGKGAVKAGMELERRMEPVVKGALEQGGLPREMALGMGANTQSNVIKPKGGNWLAGSVEKVLDPLITKGIIANKEIPYGPEFDSAIIKRIADLKEAASVPNYKGGAGRVASMLEEDLQDAVSTQNRVKNAAINKWVQSNLTNYVKKDMATPDDPVRKLAEEGISHLPTNSPLPLNMGAVKETRKEAGFPEPYGQSWQGLLYESKADKPIGFGTAGEMINRGKGEPWMEKVDPFTKVYGMSPMDSVNFTQDIGFNHIIDVLREDLTTGRIRPEQLSKVSMEQAVRRTFEYDQELAKKMDAARLTERADLPVYKEYPEEGYKWVQLTRPGDFAAESNAMGHSVRGYEPPEGHPDWTKGSGEEGSPSYGLGGWEAIKSGKAKVYSLLDSKGEPHVTIEVGANRDQLRKEDLLPYKEAALEEAKLLPNGYTDADVRDIEIRMARENLPPFIRQIKGKGNDRPISKYDPFVQEFVKSGNWNSVNDLQNTGLFKVEEGSTPPGFAEWMRLRALGNEPKVPAGYYTPEELAKYGEESGLKEKYPSVYGSWRKNLGLEPDVPMEPPPPMNGMKRGGVVISNNPDTMMLEVNNKRMKEGGSEDDTKPFFGGAGTKKYAAAKKRAEQGDVNTLRDPKTYATVAGFFGERPDEMGFSVLHPDYQAIKDVAEPAFGLGIAAQAYPLIGPLTKGLPVGASVKNVTPMKASEALGKIEGRPLKITQADRTKVGGGYLGGPGFSGLQLTEPEYRAAEAAWAVQNAGTAKTILGGGKKGDNPVYAAMIGTPTQHQSNQMVFDKLYGDFKKAAKRGELTPELRDLINMRLASAVDKKGNPVFPADVDIMDKNFRNIADTFSRRSIAGHLMGGVQVGGKKGQIIDYDKIIRSTTDPALIDQPTGALGNRLFTLSGGIIDRPDLHPAFPAILQGEDLGLTFTPVERNLVMKDFVDKTMREKKRMPGYMDYARGNPPTQLITEDILTELQKLGLKKGGAVKKAEGGYLKKPAAYINGDEFVNAAKKYGIKDSMNNLNKIVDLVNKGLSVDDAARQVADSGVHKAAGGAIRGDDLILEERPL
jgi:hypothetical protein